MRIVRLVERSLHTAARCEDFSVVEEGCMLVWNTALPLLQPNLRRSVQKALQTCSTLLEEHNSVLHRLRVSLYLELAKTDIAEDVLSKVCVCACFCCGWAPYCAALSMVWTTEPIWMCLACT